MTQPHCKPTWLRYRSTSSTVECGPTDCGQAPLAHPTLSSSRTRFRRDRRLDCGDIRGSSGKDVPAYAYARACSPSSEPRSARQRAARRDPPTPSKRSRRSQGTTRTPLHSVSHRRCGPDRDRAHPTRLNGHQPPCPAVTTSRWIPPRHRISTAIPVATRPSHVWPAPALRNVLAITICDSCTGSDARHSTQSPMRPDAAWELIITRSTTGRHVSTSLQSWISRLARKSRFGCSPNIRERRDCDFPVLTTPPQPVKNESWTWHVGREWSHEWLAEHRLCRQRCAPRPSFADARGCPVIARRTS